jgi:membrane-bound ClpP family serine protease
MIELLVEVTGAILILLAFALAQFRGLDRHGSPYLMLNLVGAAVLAVVAAIHRQWGFLLLQGVWALIALWSLRGLARSEGAPS